MDLSGDSVESQITDVLVFVPAAGWYRRSAHHQRADPGRGVGAGSLHREIQKQSNRGGAHLTQLLITSTHSSPTYTLEDEHRKTREKITVLGGRATAAGPEISPEISPKAGLIVAPSTAIDASSPTDRGNYHAATLSAQYAPGCSVRVKRRRSVENDGDDEGEEEDPEHEFKRVQKCIATSVDRRHQWHPSELQPQSQLQATTPALCPSINIMAKSIPHCRLLVRSRKLQTEVIIQRDAPSPIHHSSEHSGPFSNYRNRKKEIMAEENGRIHDPDLGAPCPSGQQGNQQLRRRRVRSARRPPSPSTPAEAPSTTAAVAAQTAPAPSTEPILNCTAPVRET
ncbi:hypothetical protein PG996_007717 [Apiospora saccharicola]|uniref:Uncharacterized protein n=1 Tax=Apiospora saccharicola TaxID=335842 RepID=A0ABR1VBL5_9PEZI